MPQGVIEREYRPFRVRGFGGVVDSIDPSLIEDGQSPSSLNIEYDRGSASTTRGSRKFNNQVAPSGAVRTVADPSCPPLYIDSAKAVPLRGAVYYPYVAELDIGGRPDSEGTAPSETFHNRRGRSFQFDVTFSLPSSEQLFEEETRGSGAPADGDEDSTFAPPHGYDEALDETICILQKGGDRMQPMSWFLGVVNIGKSGIDNGTGSFAPGQRPSNYALCFGWYDSAQHGEFTPAEMQYNLNTGALPTSGNYSTQAYRVMMVHAFIEPGRNYSVSVQLEMDSGDPGAAAVNTDWHFDGAFRIYWRCDNGPIDSATIIDSPAGTAYSKIETYKGPQDSGTYLCRYGIRFFGRDPMYAGLGMRFHPWKECAFIPYGADCAPLANGGFRMADRSASTVAALYPTATHSLTAAKGALANTYVKINHGGFTSGNNDGGLEPSGMWGGAVYLPWIGQGNAAGTSPFHPEALRGYRLVTTADFTAGAPDAKGMVLSILEYERFALNDYRVHVVSGDTIEAFVAAPVLVQSMRWHQRPLEICELRIWSGPRAYEDDTDALRASRRRLSLGRSLRTDDGTEPDLATLQAYWPMDDCEGATVRELVTGGYRDGRFTPFGLGVSEGGTRGKNLVFLSGEGEAVTIDFSSNPIAKRELEAMLKSSSQGFAIEITCVFPEAYYALQRAPQPLPADFAISGSRGRYVPDIATWEVKDSDSSGYAKRPRELIALTARGDYADGSNLKFQRPMPFSVRVGQKSDQEDVDSVTHSDLLPWYLSGGVEVPRYDVDNAPWVGRPVTIQIGIQSTGVADQYDVYIAMTPKSAWRNDPGDPGDAEWALWTDGAGTYDVAYLTSAHMTISAKDLFRSVVTVGGRWRPGGLGYSELNARILLDEIRIFATSGPGSLPSASGDYVAGRDGKLEGRKCLPPRLLSTDDLLLPLGRNLRTVNATEFSDRLAPAGSGTFHTGTAASSLESLADCLVMVRGDTVIVPDEETIGIEQEEFYRVSSVAAGGVSATLSQPYSDASRSNARAAALRVIGYTAFEDDISSKNLSVPVSAPYNPSTSTTADVLLTEPFWKNKAPVTADFRLRIFSPGVALRDILPTWVRGLVVPRRGKTGEGILGLASQAGSLFAAVRGSIYEVDDRWRDETFTVTTKKALAFLGDASDTGIVVPRANDRVEFPSGDGFLVTNVNDDANVRVFDMRVQPDEVGEYQTIVWAGDKDSDPSRTAGNSTGAHRVYLILRLSRGRPELVFGSQAAYSGALVPEKGLFIATAAATIQAGTKAHIRWYIPTREDGTIIEIPFCKVNGKEAVVSVNAREDDPAITEDTDWMRQATLVTPTSQQVLMLGAARDSYRNAPAPGALASSGDIVRPQRIQGFLHGFGGLIAEVVVTSQERWEGEAPEDFDSTDLRYTGIPQLFRVLGIFAEGRGHKVKDTASGQYGTIMSHPFLSVFHEFGRSSETVTWAPFGSQLYAANGGRPVVILPSGKGRFAGVLPPTTAPSFTLARFPIWRENVRDKLSSAGATNDPIDAAATGVATRVYHYRAEGNTFLRATLETTDSTTFTWGGDKYIGIKFYFRPETVSGRINLWRRGSSVSQGGPFIECRDGKFYFGWWDTNLKQEVSVSLPKSAFVPGETYNVHVRKRFPWQSVSDGNWDNSFFANGKMRRLTLTAGAGTFAVGELVTSGAKQGRVIKVYGAAATTLDVVLTVGAFAAADVLAGGTSGAAGTVSGTPVRPACDIAVVRLLPRASQASYQGELNKIKAAARACISYTTVNGPSGTTCSGLVTLPGTRYTGGAAGLVTALNAVEPFHPDMVGMLWQFAATNTTIFRVSGYNSPTQIVVSDTTGATTNLAGVVNQEGGVFIGQALVKSTYFDQSKAPDTDDTLRVEMLGSSLQRDTLNGFSPCVGDFWSPAYTIATGTGGSGPEVFEATATRDYSAAGLATADPIELGTDRFNFHLYAGLSGEPGELRADNNKVMWGAELRIFGTGGTYLTDDTGGNVSTQPNKTLVVAKDTSPSCAFSATSDPKWNYVQDPAVWAQANYVAATFYDPEQGVESNAGPVLTIKPSVEDLSNPSGMVRTLLRALPASRERGSLELNLYKSLSVVTADGGLLSAGSKAVQSRVAIVPDGTSEYAMSALERTFAEAPLLEFDNAPPPKCRIIAFGQDRLFYGALEEQQDGVRFSKAFSPALVPETNLLRLNSGPGAPITGMRELDGQVVGMKQEGVYAMEIGSDGLARTKIVTSGQGCVAPASVHAKDGMLLWRSDRGVTGYQRGQSTDLGQAGDVSAALKTFFDTSVDRLAARHGAATLHPQRRQYVLTTRLAGDTLTRDRVALTDNAWSIYRDPNLSALCTLQPISGGPARLIGGTEEGFVVWLDDPDTQYLLMGTDQGAYGAPTLTLLAGGTTASVEATGLLDLTLEGARGTVLRWKNANNVEQRATVIGVDDTIVHLDSSTTLAPSAGPATIGAQIHRWASKVFDFDSEKRKNLKAIELEFAAGATGTIQVEVYKDRNTTVPFKRENVALGGKEMSIQLPVEAEWMQVVVRSAPLTHGGRWELVGLTWKFVEADQR